MVAFAPEPRNPILIDALDQYEGEKFSGSVWRIVKNAKDPIAGQRSNGRWDPGNFDVLYTSLEANGAIAEIDYFLSSLIPSPKNPEAMLHELVIQSQNTLRLVDVNQLSDLGVDMENYSEREYSRTREIADVAFFLEFDGLIVPNARWQCNNLVLFTEYLDPDALEILNSSPVDFEKWRDEYRRK